MGPIMKREIVVIGQYAYIPLTQGYTATIDAADVPLVEGYNWTVIVRKYTTYVYRNDRGRGLLLHRLLMGDPEGLTVDHRDGDGLNNTRQNLRVATKAENNRNQRRHDRNTSGHKGVSWHKRDKRWRACIHVNNRYIHLGHFVNIEDAVAAYENASAELHGEFGRTA